MKNHLPSLLRAITSRHRNIMFSLLCFISTLGYAQRQTENSFRSRYSNALVGYYAYVPKDYNTNPTKNYPILIFLHGMGEKVWNPKDISQLSKVKSHGPPRLIDQGQDFPFIVISPQCPFPSWDEISIDNFKTSSVLPGLFVDEILERMKSTYRVDPSRVYITGLSMGGAGAWSYTRTHPEKIAASIPIAGWVDNGDLCGIANNDVAVWAFQGQYDSGTSIQGVVNKINNCSTAPTPAAKVTVYPGVGHDSWTRTYNNTGTGIAPDNIYDWLMRQSKSGTPTNRPPVADAGADKTIVLPNNSLTLNGTATDFDGGVQSVNWTKVSGPSASMTATNTLNLSLSNLTEGSYVFRLSVVDHLGEVDTDDVTVSVNGVQSSSNGLMAEYYSNIHLQGTPFTKVDPNIANDWGYGVPNTTIAADRFSVRWTGKIKPKYSQVYNFYTLSDDGVRLWIDNVLVVDNWTYHAVVENSGSIALNAGQLYDIKMEYFENYGGAVAKLSWSSLDQVKQIVPTDALFVTDDTANTVESLEQVVESTVLSVYPSPAINDAQMSFNASSAGDVTVEVMDELGIVKLRSVEQVDQGVNVFSFNMNDLPSGFYYVTVSQGNVKEKAKLLIAK